MSSRVLISATVTGRTSGAVGACRGIGSTARRRVPVPFTLLWRVTMLSPFDRIKVQLQPTLNIFTLARGRTATLPGISTGAFR
jgi:hypothetical protein